MILAIDTGNTNTVVGCFEGEKIHFTERISTEKSCTEFDFLISLKTILEIYNIPVSNIKGAIISSVVPSMVCSIKMAINKLTGINAIVLGPGVKTGLSIKIDNPAQLGSDFVATSVAALKLYGAPNIVFDLGTATTVGVCNAKNEYIGGMIMPGVRTSLNALSEKTSQLPYISLEPPKKIVGSNTIECMQSGILYGTAASIDGIIDYINNEQGVEHTVIATGGLSSMIIPLCKHKIIYNNDLLLQGLMMIYEKNK